MLKTEKYEDYDLFHRLTQIEKEWPGAAILMFKDGKLPQVTMLYKLEYLFNIRQFR